MRRKYIEFILILAACNYCVMVLQHIDSLSIENTSWKIAKKPTSSLSYSLVEKRTKSTTLSRTIEPIGEPNSTAVYSEGLSLPPIIGSAYRCSKNSYRGFVTTNNSSPAHDAIDIAPVSPNPIQGVGCRHTSSDARLHSYGAQGGSDVSLSHRTSRRSTESGVFTSEMACLSPLRGNGAYHGFTTVASALNGTTLADDTDTQDVPSRQKVSPGVPPLAPVGDAVLPLLLLVAIHAGRKMRCAH